MNVHGRLMARVVSHDNLCLAFYKAAKGKRNRNAVRVFESRLGENLGSLRERLSAGTMAYGQYNVFQVKDPKVRTICAAPFDQRVAHHALINIVGPLLDSTQIEHSYACRTGKGQHKALVQARRWASGSGFYLKMDIQKYFDSIAHKRVMEILEGRIKDPHVLQMFSDIIASYATSPGRGMPLGNLTSQYLANLYLESFDHWVCKDMGRTRYMRYMDDMLLFGDKQDLLFLRGCCREYLEIRRGLKIRHGGEINRVKNGIGFLGAVVYPRRIRLSSPGKKRIRARVKNCERKYRAGTLDEKELQQRVVSLWAGLSHFDSSGWKSRLAARCMDI